MSFTPLIIAGANTVQMVAGPPASTAYFACFCASGRSSTDTDATRITYRKAGEFSRMWVRINANDIGATSTVNFRVNGVTVNQSISIPTATTGVFQDTTNKDTIASGDKVNYEFNIGAGGTGITITCAGILFKADTSIKYAINQSTSVVTASTKKYNQLAGQTQTQAAEAPVQFKAKTAGTLRNLLTNIATNTRTTSATFGSRINGADGTLLITIPASTSGTFEDTSNSDAVAIGDLINYYTLWGSGTGGTTPNYFSIDFQSTNNKCHLITGQSNTTSNTIVQATTKNLYFSGSACNSLTESDVKCLGNTIFKASNLECYVGANTVTLASTLFLRKNGANGNMNISITGLTTGYFEDTTNSDDIIATDDVNYQVVAGVGGTSLVLCTVGVLATFPPSGTDALFFAGD